MDEISRNLTLGAMTAELFNASFGNRRNNL